MCDKKELALTIALIVVTTLVILVLILLLNINNSVSSVENKIDENPRVMIVDMYVNGD